jgi:hypothetical protein
MALSVTVRRPTSELASWSSHFVENLAKPGARRSPLFLRWQIGHAGVRDRGSNAEVRMAEMATPLSTVEIRLLLSQSAEYGAG